MDSISIKIPIAGRNYPLTIPSKDEEEVRNAAKKLDTFIRDLQQKYSVQDKQDLLAMAALHMATKVESLESTVGDNALESKMDQLIEILSDADS